MMFRRSTILRSKKIKKRRTSLIPWKDLERFRRFQPQGPPLPPTCSHIFSKYGCSSLDRAEVESFHRKFYFTRNRASQDAFILRHCQGRSPLRRTSEAVYKKRKITADYFVPAKGSKVQVCKPAFLGILRVQRSRVDTVVKISKCQGNQLSFSQSSLSVQQRTFRTDTRKSRRSTIHKRKSTTQSIFTRLCSSQEHALATEVQLYKTKKYKKSTLKRQSFKRRQSTIISTDEDDSLENLSKLVEVDELKLGNISESDENTIGMIKDDTISGEKVIEKQLRFRETVNLIEFHNQQDHSSLDDVQKTGPITSSEGPLAEIDRRLDEDWLDESLRSQRSRTFDWSPLKRPLVRPDVAAEETTPSLKVPSLVYESRGRKLSKLMRTLQDKENFTEGNSKQRENKKLGLAIIAKNNLEKNSLWKNTQPKSRLPLQTIQYFKN